MNYLYITILFMLGSYRLFAQPGNPFIKNYPPSSYQNNAYVSSPQNWGVIQDNRGIIYVSNTSGVLEYDGINWQLVSKTGYEGRFQFAKTSNGKIYVCSTNDMGYLAPDTTGKMQFVSLMPYLHRKYKDISIKWIAALGDNVYFSNDEYIFRWSGEQFKVWKSRNGFLKLFPVRDKLYASNKELGLCLLEGENLKTIPGGEGFKDLTVTALLPVQNDSSTKLNLLVVTFENGLHLFKDRELLKLETKPENTLDTEYFMGGQVLADSTIALATINRGVVIIDKSGKVRKVVDKQSGLADNTVLCLYNDKEGGIWAGLNKGLSRIDYPSPVTYLNETAGLEGIVLEVLKKKEYLYAGTSSGLYVLDETDAAPAFRKLPQLQSEVWEMLDLKSSLLIVNTQGVYILNGSETERVSPSPNDIIYKSAYQSKSNPDKIYIGSSDGLSVIIQNKGEWKWQGKVKGIDHDVIWLAGDKKNRLWASCNDNISFVDDSQEYGLQPPVRNYRPPASLTKDLLRYQAHIIDGKVYFGTSIGIYSFKKIGEHLKLLPDASFGTSFADGSREARNLTTDSNGNIWLTSEFRTGRLRKLQDKAYVWDTIPLMKMPRVDVWSIHSDATGVVWLGTTEGIYRYDPGVTKSYKAQQHTVLRKVKLSGDSTVFFGAFANSGNTTVTQTPRFKFELPHAIRSISFEYAATSFDAPEQVKYSYMLEGEDKKWSNWTTETKKEFNGIDEGDYIFKVRSKNVYGAISPVSTFEFESLSPFYRTWLAYGIYALAWVLIVWGIIKIKHRHLIASKISLEKTVHERTAQLEAEKKKSDDLLLNILPATTANELKANGRTVARRYENVTVLFTDFKDFTRISEDLTPEELVAVIDFFFCAFDRIIARYNIEKIKTIGDAYMCAGGVPDPGANTPTDVVKAALEILAFVKNLNPENRPKKYRFEIRIGIHTGPVVAGVVGTQKFAYDIWGDTVNTAARMESSCKEGKINISGATYEQVKDDFICSYRGKIDAKNKGEIEMYFVEAVASEPVLA